MHGFSQILLEDYGPTLGPPGRELAERISAAGERMDTLIKDLLAYSRLTREEIRISDLDLDAVVRDILLDMAKELAESGASVSIEDKLPRVQGHAVTLSQALTNLLGNAIKFVAPGTAPRVKIRAEPRGDMIRLWIEDNGIGIAPEHSTKLFRLFERLHGRERYPGTGIGLAIVRRALERMGGTSGFVSRLGQGSRFWIELPKTGSQRAMPAAKKTLP
jgi:signal transduction histidine kinase